MHRVTYTNSSYRTARKPLSFWPRTFPSLLLYSKIIAIVVKGGMKARRGKYENADWCWSSLCSLRALEHVGVTVTIEGTEHFTSLHEPCVFIANHMSTLETFVLPVLISPYRNATFVVKESLMHYPFFGQLLGARNPITVGRDNPREDLKAVLEGGAARLNAGISLIIFPQTTRTPTLDPESFNTIGIKLAKKAGVPVVPVALKTDAWGNGKYLKDFGRIDPAKTVHFAFGKPLRIKDRGNEEHQAVIRFITEKLKEWGGEVTAASSASSGT